MTSGSRSQNPNPSSPPSASSGRKRHKSSKQQEQDAVEAAQRHAKQARKAQGQLRKDDRERRRAGDVGVEQDNDSEIIKELKAANRRLRQERNAALRVADEKSACTSHSADTASQQTTIARPKNLDHVKIADLREMLGLAGPEHKSEWNNLRASIASQIAGAHLDTSQTFAKQEKSRLALLFNSIERKHPALRKFAVSWVTERLCKETYNKHRYYANSKDREGSYYYHKSLERSQAPRVATASGTASNKSDTPRARAQQLPTMVAMMADLITNRQAFSTQMQWIIATWSLVMEVLLRRASSPLLTSA
ncbi:hypothetical protein BC834DRAFT_843968 [Gloeopeniophorella convolvens]|nr:hypothetical protein BC834DRAFT_843968 [Gloeopeniophorella convolvens]